MTTLSRLALCVLAAKSSANEYLCANAYLCANTYLRANEYLCANAYLCATAYLRAEARCGTPFVLRKAPWKRSVPRSSI